MAGEGADSESPRPAAFVFAGIAAVGGASPLGALRLGLRVVFRMPFGFRWLRLWHLLAIMQLHSLLTAPEVHLWASLALFPVPFLIFAFGMGYVLRNILTAPLHRCSACRSEIGFAEAHLHLSRYSGLDLTSPDLLTFRFLARTAKARRIVVCRTCAGTKFVA